MRVKVTSNKDLNRIGQRLMREASHLTHESDKILVEGANRIRNRIIQDMMQTAKGGRLYGKHVSSRPGQAPAVQYGRLVESVLYEVSRGQVEIGGKVHYAKYLEMGTRKMARRPWLQINVDREMPWLINEMTSIFKDIGRRTFIAS